MCLLLPNTKLYVAIDWLGADTYDWNTDAKEHNMHFISPLFYHLSKYELLTHCYQVQRGPKNKIGTQWVPSFEWNGDPMRTQWGPWPEKNGDPKYVFSLNCMKQAISSKCSLQLKVTWETSKIGIASLSFVHSLWSNWFVPRGNNWMMYLSC